MPLSVTVHTRRLLQSVQDRIHVGLLKLIMEAILYRVIVRSQGVSSLILQCHFGAEGFRGGVNPWLFSLVASSVLILPQVALEVQLVFVVRLYMLV